MRELTAEQRRRLGCLARSPEGEALVAYLSGRLEQERAQCVAGEGVALTRAQGAARVLGSVLDDLKAAAKAG